MKIHIFALWWKDEIRRPSQLRTLLKRVVVNKTRKKFQAHTGCFSTEFQMKTIIHSLYPNGFGVSQK